MHILLHMFEYTQTDVIHIPVNTYIARAYPQLPMGVTNRSMSALWSPLKLYSLTLTLTLTLALILTPTLTLTVTLTLILTLTP